MADKSISELVAATSVGSADLFVLEQASTAKKLTGQILENWLVSFADGHGGIQSIAKTGTSGTNPVVDTYTITLADETTFNFTVTNGIKGDTGAQTYVWVKWAAQEPTADNQMSNNPDEWIGIYIGLSSTAPAHYTDYTWYKYKGEQGSPGYAVDDVVWHESSGGNVPGIAGATDTYFMYLDDPNNTFAGQFVVYNGNDGQGSPGSQTPLSDSGSGSVGAATAYSREDHRHPLNVDSTAPANLGTPASGSASTYARRDHVHKMPTASDVGALPANTSFVSSVNGQTGDASVASYSSGTDGIWTYRQYSDGTYHAWYEGAVNLLAGTAFAGGFFHQSSAALTPPSFSTAVTSLSGSPNGAMLMAYVGRATDYSTYWFNGIATASNNQLVRLDMYGTW